MFFTPLFIVIPKHKCRHDAILALKLDSDVIRQYAVSYTHLSVNLHIAGRANVQLFSFQTLFKNEFIAGLPSGIQPYAPVILMALISLVVKLLMDAYLSTRSGFLLRATGDNPTLVASLAKDSGKVKILGLAIANALVALSGCIMCQYQRYFDISMGTGTLVLAVASVIVGTQDVYKRQGLPYPLYSPPLSAVSAQASVTPPVSGRLSSFLWLQRWR